jgi:hypothetical protein
MAMFHKQQIRGAAIVKDFNRMCLFLPPVAILGMVYYSV